MRVLVDAKYEPEDWRGTNELRRLSSVVTVRPMLSLFGRLLPLGPWTVAYELIREFREPTEWRTDIEFPKFYIAP